MRMLIILLAIAFVVIVWKMEKNTPPERRMFFRPGFFRTGFFRTGFFGPGSLPPAQHRLSKAMVLVALVFGALSPNFRNDEITQPIHILCTLALAGMSYVWMFRRPR